MIRTALAVFSSVLVFASAAHADEPPLPPPPTQPASWVEQKTTVSTSVAVADKPVETAKPTKNPDDDTFLHGFRIGYGYVMNYDKPVASLDGKSLKDRVDLRTPSHFLIGYEVVDRVIGHSWLNVILIANGMIAGLEQSRVLPTGNFLIGAELKNSFQIGVGASLSPLKGFEAHTIIAAGWTPRIGTIYTPVHLFFIPDVDGVNRMGMTTGVTF